jgi:hypothetical protein
VSESRASVLLKISWLRLHMSERGEP